VVGRLHSWSRALVADDVLLDLRHLNDIRVDQRGDHVWAEVGAGCQIKHLLIELEKRAGVTLPSLGLITEQTLVGAAATGTHGSGKNSLSHYIAEMRLATYDPETGTPMIRVIVGGPELRAARCSLGCLGVVVSVGLWCRPQYQVEEHMRRYQRLDDVLAAEEQFPLQQFFLIPWLWAFLVQHRREVATRRSALATLYRCYFFLVFDVGLHLVLLPLVRWGRRGLVRRFFRRMLPWTVVQRQRVVDRSQAMLVMEHELFRHIEIEMFVTRSRIRDALAYIEDILKYFDGDDAALTSSTRECLGGIGLLRELDERRGSYTHHYPICVRRVLADDTMLSMASGVGEPYYAVSFISYDRPEHRRGFLELAEFLSRSMGALFGARPHWGKICPVTAEEVVRLYPELSGFRAVCAAFDPAGVFRNDWLDRVLFGARG